MDRLHLMAMFVAVAEEESFARAARRLGVSPPAVTRGISALEERLGVRLLTRTTRAVRVTEAGARYVEDCRRILADADEADAQAAGLNGTPRGELRVTASVLFGQYFVMPVIQQYLERHAEVSVQALFVDRRVNLLEEGIDVAVRIGPLPDSSLRAIQVGTLRRVVCAAPAYLEAQGLPVHPAELARHRVIAATSQSPTPDWKFHAGNTQLSVRVAPRLTVSSNDAAIAAATSGWGLTRVMSYMIAPQLRAGQLRIVLADYEPPALPVHVLHQEGRKPSAKVRTFVDLIVAHLRADPALN